MQKKLKSNLSIAGIRNLKQEINNYKNEINRKNVIFIKRLAEVGIPIIDINIANAKGDSNKNHNTYIKLTSGSTYSRAVLTVEGVDLLFIEFGAGIHYNGHAGSSPNPKGKDFNYTIGGYGQGKGLQDSWTYYSDSGEWIRSYGTEATMPLYEASLKIIEDIQKIAKKVFGS